MKDPDNERRKFWELVESADIPRSAIELVAGSPELVDAFLEYHQLGMTNDPSWPVAYQRFSDLYSELAITHGLSEDDASVVARLILANVFEI